MALTGVAARRADPSAAAHIGALEIDSRAYIASLKRELDRLELDTEEKLWRLGLMVQNNARRLCPVDTGRLRSSITATRGRDGRGPYVAIGTNVQYAPFVEFGTRHQRAQPYLRPALGMAVSQAGRVLK
jgi:HK97 gp10 family phage protein